MIQRSNTETNNMIHLLLPVTRSSLIEEREPRFGEKLVRVQSDSIFFYILNLCNNMSNKLGKLFHKENIK